MVALVRWIVQLLRFYEFQYPKNAHSCLSILYFKGWGMAQVVEQLPSILYFCYFLTTRNITNAEMHFC
jgi:hypothetical protein